MPKSRKHYPPVDEETQRFLNTQFWPYCDTACEHFEYVAGAEGEEPVCNATSPRTFTLFTGKCVCPRRRRVAYKVSA